MFILDGANSFTVAYLVVIVNVSHDPLRSFNS